MTNDIQNTPVVKRESKNKIRVDFERTDLKQRLKEKFLSTYFLKNTVWYVFRLMLLIGIAFVVIQPFITMIIQSLKDPVDYRDSTVVNVPRNLSLIIYKAIFTDGAYLKFFFKTLGLSLSVAVLQTLSCCLVGYGLAKFKFRGSKIVFFLVILTLVVPHGTLQAAIYYYFSKLSLLNTVVPLLLMSVGALAFKNGLYIFMLRQFFRGVPDELEESAYLDGANTFRTFVQVILPISIPMMITVFLFSFCWQWTDDFYLTLFYVSNPKPEFMAFITQKELTSLVVTESQAGGGFTSAEKYGFGLMACIPLIVLFLFCQKYLVQGIERSGIVG